MGRNSKGWLLRCLVFALLSASTYGVNSAAEDTTPKRSRTGIQVERQDDTVWITRRTNEQGKVLEVIPRRWFEAENRRGATLELHGNREVFDDAGVCVQSQWYFKGKAVSHDEFIHLSETVTLEEPKKAKETDEDKEAKSFLLSLSLAWRNKALGECHSLITAKRKASPDWVPAIIAEYGYLMFVDRDEHKALKALELIKQLAEVRRTQAAQSDSSPLGAHLWKMFFGIHHAYVEQTAKGLQEELHLLGGKATKLSDARDESMLFPPSDLMTAYLLASGVRINMTTLSKAVASQMRQPE
jgi:hypothetical protein